MSAAQPSWGQAPGTPVWAQPGWTPPQPQPSAPKKGLSVKAKVGIAFGALVLVGAIAGAAGGGSSSTNTGDTTSNFSDNSNTPTTYSQATVNGALQVQGAVCELIGQGYTSGQIIDALAQEGYTQPDMAGLVQAAANTCP